jgi:hypothetical protein
MNDISSEIPQEVADIIRDFNIIANLPSGSKLNIRFNTYDDADSWWDAGWRWYYEESNQVTIDHINTKIDKAIEIGRKYPNWINTIADSVHSIEDSIIRLETVYSRKKYAKMRGALETIKIRINVDNFIKACKTSPPIPIPKASITYNRHNSAPSDTPESIYTTPSSWPHSSSLPTVPRSISSARTSEGNSPEDDA